MALKKVKRNMVSYNGTKHMFEYMGVKVAAEEVFMDKPLHEYNVLLQRHFKRHVKKLARQRIEQFPHIYFKDSTNDWL